MFRHLLVPLDGAPPSEAAVPVAAFLADKAGASVTLLHVVERDAPATVHGERHLTTAEQAEVYLRGVAQRAFPPSAPVSIHVHKRTTQEVAHSLADHVEELEPDLVVMLSHGRPRLRQRVLGTMAQQLVGRGLAPVLLVRPGQDARAAMPFRQLLAPLDGRAEHEAGLGAAADVARLCGAPVHLLMVVPRLGDLGGERAAASQLLPSTAREMLDQSEHRGVEYLAGISARLQAQGVCSSAAVARGRPERVIRQAVRERQADLVVLGTHGQAGTKAFWAGSLGAKLIGGIEASFLLAPAN